MTCAASDCSLRAIPRVSDFCLESVSMIFRSRGNFGWDQNLCGNIPRNALVSAGPVLSSVQLTAVCRRSATAVQVIGFETGRARGIV